MMVENMSLQNKVALVTGANRGIGAALVRELLRAGVAKVYAGARRPGSLPEFGDARVLALPLDVTDDASVASAAASARDIDVLINNAGTAAPNTWTDARSRRYGPTWTPTTTARSG